MKLDKKLVLISLGSALEYYDFVLYGLLATYISKTFFPEVSSTAQLMQTFTIFALGYLIRPLGGTILGIIADRYSKVKVFVFSILLMGISTFAIGIIPSYSQIGIFSTILLILARVGQGVSFSSELPGAVTLISGSHFKTQIGRSIGFLMASTNFGFILASLVVYGMHALLNETEVEQGGWRVPFIMGGIFAFISFYVRRSLENSDEFKTMFATKAKTNTRAFVFSILKNHANSIFIALGIMSIISSGTIFLIYLSHFVEDAFHFESKEVSFYFFSGLVSFIIFSGVVGKVVQNSHKKRLFSFALMTFPMVLYCFLHLIKHTYTYPGMILGPLFIVYEMYMAIFFTIGLSFISELFPFGQRNTCIAFCYNTTFSVASMLPIFFSHFTSLPLKIDIIVSTFLLISVIAFLSCYLFFKEDYKNESKATRA